MADEQPSFYKAYQRAKAERRAELGKLQRRLADRKPAGRFILALFFGMLSLTIITMGVSPLGFPLALVAAVSLYSGFNLWGASKQLRRVVADENYRWNLRDIAMSKLSPDGFETLGKAVAGGGSYASVTAYLMRRGLDDVECDAMILAASAAGEELGVKHMADDGEQKHLDLIAKEEASWGGAGKDEAPPTGAASSEGLHAQLLNEEDDAVKTKLEADQRAAASSDAADDDDDAREAFGR